MRLPSDGDRTGRDLGDEELQLLREVIESGTLNCTKGTQVKAFERAFAARYGIAHARAVTSGTAAIHAAVAAIDPEPGDEIVTTPVTDMGGIAPILYQQAIPVFADVDPLTLNVTPQTIAARIGPRTRAIIATHLFGNPCDIAGIIAVADAHSIPVIEDCAQAYLATQHGRLVGTIGTIGTFSLQQGKHMTTGEGGVVITACDAFARRMTLFSDKAWGYGDPAPDHYFLALNYRMTDLQGAVARAQLAKLDGVVARRQAAAMLLNERLADIEGLTLPVPVEGSTHAFWRYALMVDPAVLRGGADVFGAALQERGIACTPRYIRKPAFECEVLSARRTYGRSQCPYTCRERADGTRFVYDRADYPGTMRGLERVVVFPWNEFYREEQVAFIADAVRDVARRAQARGTRRKAPVIERDGVPPNAALAVSAPSFNGTSRSASIGNGASVTGENGRASLATRREARPRPYAILSCDLDTVDRHLQGYGFTDMAPCDRIYRTAVPRLLALLDELGVPGVFFVVGRDALAERALLRQIVAAGHEIASHSMTHPQPFRALADTALTDEIAGSRARLSEASGSAVVGFRAPGWDVDARILAHVEAAGYRYDASMFPTPALLAARLAISGRSPSQNARAFAQALGHAFASPLPHHPAGVANGLVEFPMAVTPWLRLPVYHTFSYFVPERVFARALRRLLRSSRPLCYEFHAADLLDFVDDRIDARMVRHPGMQRPLARKRAALRDILARIAAERRVVTYRQALDEGLAG